MFARTCHRDGVRRQVRCSAAGWGQKTDSRARHRSVATQLRAIESDDEMLGRFDEPLRGISPTHNNVWVDMGPVVSLGGGRGSAMVWVVMGFGGWFGVW